MKSTRLFSLILAVAMLFNLCGCSVFTVDTNELLSPPELTGELAPIAEALSKKADAGYVLKYPSEGNYRSAVIQNDINGDGIFEAFALYSTVEGDVTYMHINVILNKSGEWVSVADQKVVAGGVDSIDFADINSDGIQEILVGWSVYGTTEKQLAVYTLEGEVLSQRMLQRYTHFLCADMNKDNENEIFIVNFNVVENLNYAALYNLTDTGVEEISRCALDSGIESVSAPKLSTLSNGTPAIYIDEIKGAGAITEVVFMEKNTLVNPLLSSNTGQNILTLRSSTIASRDINDDGIVEIPIQSVLPSVFYKNHEPLYYTDWYSFNGEMLARQLCTVMNFDDGYYVEVPNNLQGKISVLKDTDRHIRIFYEYDEQTETIGEEIARVQAVSEALWDRKDYDKNGLTELARSGGTVFAFKISASNDEKKELTEQLKMSFKLINQEAIG